MTAVEDVDSFRIRARSWIRDNLRSLRPEELSTAWMGHLGDAEQIAALAHDRKLQRMFFDAGFAGICFPKEYGGQGLPPEYQRVLNQELAGYEYPSLLAVPTLSPCAAVLLDFGTEEQKLRHIPAILKGEEMWSQLLSEPGGGSMSRVPPPPPFAMATSGSSTARKSGPHAPGSRTGDCAWPAPTGMSRNTRVCRCSSSP